VTWRIANPTPSNIRPERRKRAPRPRCSRSEMARKRRTSRLYASPVNGRNRHVSFIPVRPGDGLLSELIAGAQARRREPPFMPPNASFESAPSNGEVGWIPVLRRHTRRWRVTRADSSHTSNSKRPVPRSPIACRSLTGQMACWATPCYQLRWQIRHRYRLTEPQGRAHLA
jgi:hypothetical protein